MWSLVGQQDWKKVYIPAGSGSVIPEVSLDQIWNESDTQFPEDVRDQIHKRGCVIVRKTFDEEEASEILDGLKEYMLENGQDPEDQSRTFYEIYWSKAQVLEILETFSPSTVTSTRRDPVIVLPDS